jgi:predicted protein tyrosine phosphatase
MEEKHRSILLARFDRTLLRSSIHVLDVPDDYRFMDEELVDLLRQLVDDILGQEEAGAS